MKSEEPQNFIEGFMNVINSPAIGEFFGFMICIMGITAVFISILGLMAWACVAFCNKRGI